MSTLNSILNGIAVLMLTIVLSVALFSQPPANLSPATPDPQIAAALYQVSREHIQQTIEKLVSFETRSTLSSDMPASSGNGATAAAEWIRSEFERYAKACGGCLEVKTDEFTQEPGPRLPSPTKITNVYEIGRASRR